MNRPDRLFSEQRATQAELLEHIQAWREYAAYLEGRLDPTPAKATPRKSAPSSKLTDPNEAAELVARSLIRLFSAPGPISVLRSEQRGISK